MQYLTRTFFAGLLAVLSPAAFAQDDAGAVGSPPDVAAAAEQKIDLYEALKAWHQQELQKEAVKKATERPYIHLESPDEVFYPAQRN